MLEIVKIQDLYFLRTNFKLRIPDLIKRIKRQNGMKEDSFAEKYVIKILTDLLSGAIDLSEIMKEVDELFVTNPFLIFIIYILQCLINYRQIFVFITQNALH